jgi:predicted small secreted protein
MLRKTVLALITGSMALTIAACNTVKGAGEDLQSASQTTEDAINGR